MINIAICDDEQNYIDVLSKALERYMAQSKEKYTYETFLSGSALLKTDFSKFDMIFLDVKMDNVNGIMVAEEIKKKMKLQLYFLFLPNLNMPVQDIE